MRTLILTIIFFAFVSADAQTAPVWFKVANEGDAVTATATVRYGIAQGTAAVSGTPCALVGGCWKQLSVSGAIKANNATFGDPIPGTAKELDVLETATAQQVTVNGKALTVPAKPTYIVITCTTLPTPTPLPDTSTIAASCTVVKQ